MKPRYPKMDKDVRNGIVLSMYMSVEALLLEPSGEAANAASRLMAIMTTAIDAESTTPISKRTDPASMAVVAACNALTSIDERHDRTGKWGMTGEEAKALRSSMARFDEALLNVPWPIYKAAAEFVDGALGGKIAVRTSTASAVSPT